MKSRQSVTAFLLLTTMAGGALANIEPDARPANIDLGCEYWKRVADKHGVDAALLYATALRESQRTLPNGAVTAWPWVLARAGVRTDYDHFESAAQALRAMLDQGLKNIDIGAMQINWRWHGQSRFPDPTELLKPHNNIELGAKLLSRATSSTSDTSLGVGRYHSWKPDKAYPFGTWVLTMQRHLQETPCFNQ